MDANKKKIIGKRLLAVRLALGLSQKEVAERLSISPPGYHYIESGRNALQKPLIALLEARLRVRPDYIMHGHDPMLHPEKKKSLRRPVYMLYTVYLVEEYMKKKGLSVGEFAKKISIDQATLGGCIENQHISDDIIEKISRNIPELGAEIRASVGDVMDSAAQQKKIIEQEEKIKRLEKTVDKLLNIATENPPVP